MWGLVLFYVFSLTPDPKNLKLGLVGTLPDVSIILWYCYVSLYSELCVLGAAPASIWVAPMFLLISAVLELVNWFIILGLCELE